MSRPVFATIAGPLLGIIRGTLLRFELSAFLHGLVNPAENRNAPAAAGAGVEAIGQLGGVAGPLAPRVVQQLAQRNVKAQADIVIRLHA